MQNHVAEGYRIQYVTCILVHVLYCDNRCKPRSKHAVPTVKPGDGILYMWIA